MPVLPTNVDRTSPQFHANRQAMLATISEFEQLMAKAREGGGPKYVKRHLARGKLLARQRIELLVDRDSPFLELSTLACWGTDKNLGGNLVTGIGVVEGVECVISANDPTSQAGSMHRIGSEKGMRAQEIARANRMPLINLVESGGAVLPEQAEVFVNAGATFRNLTQLSQLGIPTIALVFGNSTAGGAYLPGMADYAVMVKERAKVFLGGPPLVKMATGEESTDEELGGAEMHARVSGLADYFAVDELDALRTGREIVTHLNWRKRGYGPTRAATEPEHDPEDLLGFIPEDLRIPFDMRELLARVLDGSLFDEYKALYGPSIVTGWGSVHGFSLGVIANQQGVIFSEEAHKATEFIMLCNRYDLPILFIHNTTGYMVGRDYEQRGIIKDGAKMINAVANSTVPHLSLLAGSLLWSGQLWHVGTGLPPSFSVRVAQPQDRGDGTQATGGSDVHHPAGRRRKPGRALRRRVGHCHQGQDRESDLGRGTGLLRHLPHLGRRFD